MRILVVTNHSGMLYNFRRELIGELLRNNEVTISMPFVGHEEDFEKMGARCINTDVDRRGTSIFKDLSLIKAYRKILKEEKPDLMITYSIKANVYAGYFAGRLGVPYYANVQGLGTAFQTPLLSAFVSFLYRKALKKSERVFFENQPNADFFVEKKIIPREKTLVLSGAGVNSELFAYQPYPENEKTSFLFAGRIMKEKGIDELIESAKKLKAEGYNFVLDMAGFFEDEYQTKIEKLQEEGIIAFHGFQDSLKEFYAKADCIVMPSYHEGMNNVILEGSSCGRAVIASDIPGCREAVEDGVTGFLCKSKDVETLYGAMKRFLELPRDERIKLGEAAREKMVREFEKHIVVEKIMNVLRKV